MSFVVVERLEKMLAPFAGIIDAASDEQLRQSSVVALPNAGGGYTWAVYFGSRWPEKCLFIVLTARLMREATAGHSGKDPGRIILEVGYGPNDRREPGWASAYVSPVSSVPDHVAEDQVWVPCVMNRLGRIFGIRKIVS